MKTSRQQKLRRPRSRPTPTGKRTTITDNDIFGIFEPLSRHAQLTTKQIVAFDRRYPTRTRKRLTDLYHERGEWLERLGEHTPLANTLFVDELHRLGKDAEELLVARGIVPAAEWVRMSRIGGSSKTPSRILRLSHDHMASQIALDIELGARAAAKVAFRNHIQIVEAAPTRTRALPKPLRMPVPPIPGTLRWIEPDALFALGDRLYAIEADTGTESIEGVIKQKIRAYREVVASRTVDDHFGFDNLTVLFVTTNETRVRNMMAAVASIARNGRSAMFGFACWPELGDFRHAPTPDGGMFRTAWKRAGYDPLRFE